MSFQSFLEGLDIIWPIIGSILLMISKIGLYFKTKVQEHRFYNMDSTYVLIEYELIAPGIISLLAIFSTIIFGQSTWENVFFLEYGIALISHIIIYVIGIIVIVRLKMKGGLKNYIINILLAVFIYIFLLGPFFLEVIDKKNSTIEFICILCVFLLFLLQIVLDVKMERVISLEYYVYTANEEYTLLYKPIKYGKYFYLRIHDENKKEIKRVQIPEDKIVKIEYIIHEISKSDEEKLQDPLIGDVELENETKNCERIKGESNDKIEKEK